MKALFFFYFFFFFFFVLPSPCLSRRSEKDRIPYLGMPWPGTTLDVVMASK